MIQPEPKRDVSYSDATNPRGAALKRMARSGTLPIEWRGCELQAKAAVEDPSDLEWKVCFAPTTRRRRLQPNARAESPPKRRNAGESGV